jgi:hypothetical protein
MTAGTKFVQKYVGRKLKVLFHDESFTLRDKLPTTRVLDTGHRSVRVKGAKRSAARCSNFTTCLKASLLKICCQSNYILYRDLTVNC